MKTNFPNTLAYKFATENNLGEQAYAIRFTPIVKWEKPFKTSVRRGLFIELLTDSKLLDNFMSKHWSIGFEDEGKKQIEFLLKIKEDYERFLEGVESENEEQEEQEPESLKFPLENHLRDFLAKNLDKVESGLSLYSKDGISGIEFPVDGGRIDILAIDKNKRPVVLELKLSQGRNKVLGQILYYMSWVDKNLGVGNSRGIIIASEIYPELQLAASRAPGVQLAVYKMQFSIEPINNS